MADLAATAVVVNNVWKEGGTISRRFLVKDVTLTLTGQGGTTNQIPASLFGMSEIVDVRGARTSADALVVASPDYTGDNILLGPTSLEATGDAETLPIGTAADFTGTVRLVVVGYE